ncbi:MAG: hypothetical protein N2252_00520 [Candidatus Kryptonium sp.]|nr:hypothetical protein [Candidatus Kryptonium sp.]
MRRFISILGVILFILSFTFFLSGCADNPVGVSTGKPRIVNRDGQINLLKWSDEFKQEILAKKGFDGKWVFPFKDAIVGGKKTYNNSVYIPAGAVSKPTYVTVEVLGGDYAAVEFNPSMTFNKNVTITLSYAGVDLGGRSPYDLKPVWYNPETGNWEYVNSPVTVNTSKQTISFQTNHFSRYGWSW